MSRFEVTGRDRIHTGLDGGVESLSSSKRVVNFKEFTPPNRGVSAWGTKVESSDSAVGLSTLGTTIGCNVTACDDDLSFSGVNCYLVGSHEGRSGQYVNIKILDDEAFQRKRSAMTNHQQQLPVNDRRPAKRSGSF